MNMWKYVRMDTYDDSCKCEAVIDQLCEAASTLSEVSLTYK